MTTQGDGPVSVHDGLVSVHDIAISVRDVAISVHDVAISVRNVAVSVRDSASYTWTSTRWVPVQVSPGARLTTGRTLADSTQT